MELYEFFRLQRQAAFLSIPDQDKPKALFRAIEEGLPIQDAIELASTSLTTYRLVETFRRINTNPITQNNVLPSSFEESLFIH